MNPVPQTSNLITVIHDWVPIFISMVSLGISSFALYRTETKEKRKNEKQKHKLLKAIYHEVNELSDFVSNTRTLTHNFKYKISTNIIEETTNEQREVLDNLALNKALDKLRETISEIKKEFEDLLPRPSDRLTPSLKDAMIHQMHEAGRSNRAITSWRNKMKDRLELIRKIKKLINDEESGIASLLQPDREV
ncbi:MAG TPA: TM1812 family CRISPR-associated protein [bacterium]|nr:TM1812 family CRISPR-associated protein [bacterium]